VIEKMRAAADERGVSIALDPKADATVLAIIDSGRLDQALSELADNAVRFTPSGGRVELGVTALEQLVEITVRDTGKGIASAWLSDIFDWRVNSSRTPRDGPGLGLGLVRGLVELQGGRVSVESREGEGATFTIRVPRAMDRV
jgi:signal transduction histidine kinase